MKTDTIVFIYAVIKQGCYMLQRGSYKAGRRQRRLTFWANATLESGFWAGDGLDRLPEASVKTEEVGVEA